MAGHASGDRPGARAVNGQQGDAPAQLGLREDEQSLADGEQTLSDVDQTSSDSDQTSAERDQSAADRDQAASDRDLAAGVDAAAYEPSRDIRRRSARARAQTARARLHVAAARDAVAQTRDLAARARDLAAAARDRAMAELDVASVQQDGTRALTGAEVVSRAGALRARAAQYRARAAEHRARAAEDREAAAHERELGARERLSTLDDLDLLARELAVAETDALTGLRTRAAGVGDLDRELDRCRRAGSTLSVAYVGVVGLQVVNDNHRHTAGNALLKDVAACVRAHLRGYDVIVRFGDDEVVCAMPGMTMTTARERFSQISAALAAGPEPRAIRTGFAELALDESVSELIARADRDLIAAR